jgi:hypothetical protein
MGSKPSAAFPRVDLFIRSESGKESKNFASRQEMQVSQMQASLEYLQPFGLLSCTPKQDG